jgi:uncharacterized protein (DUF1684 family)
MSLKIGKLFLQAKTNEKRLTKRLNFKNFAVILALMTMIAATASGQTSYNDEIQKWREKREAELKSEDGWLTVVGLFWLKEGINRIGAASSNEIVLPANSAPNQLGEIDFHQGKAVLRVADGAQVFVNDQIVKEFELQVEKKGKPDTIRVGDIRLFVIKRGDRYGVRVKNRNSKERLGFEGLKYFPTQKSYRITAKFIAYEKPKEIEIVNIIGDVSKMQSPGYVLFRLQGKAYRLQPVLEDKQLFFIFRDLTSGKTTYPAGRFLYADLPQGDTVVLDFNQAINPPCAFTSFATCPLPPPQNHLKTAVLAGEQNYHHSDS